MPLKLKRLPSWRTLADDAKALASGLGKRQPTGVRLRLRRLAAAGTAPGMASFDGGDGASGRQSDRDELLSNWMFFWQWLSNPTEIGAPWPSAGSLTRLMAEAVERPETARVIELGGGTGRVTAALLRRGVQPENLTVVEFNPHMAATLRRRFPGVSVVEGDAQELRRLLGIAADTAIDGLPGGGWDAVVSGLPLVSMPRKVRHGIVDAAFSVLAAHGRFVQFTYMLRCPIRPPQRQRLGAGVRKAGFTWTNFPPARVFVLEREGAGKVTADR